MARIVGSLMSCLDVSRRLRPRLAAGHRAIGFGPGPSRHSSPKKDMQPLLCHLAGSKAIHRTVVLFASAETILARLRHRKIVRERPPRINMNDPPQQAKQSHASVNATRPYGAMGRRVSMHRPTWQQSKSTIGGGRPGISVDPLTDAKISKTTRAIA